jgi:hypothetical protein
MLVRPRNTKKTSEVLEKPEDLETGKQPDNNTPPPLGTAAMEERRLPVRGRWISSTRS